MNNWCYSMVKRSLEKLPALCKTFLICKQVHNVIRRLGGIFWSCIYPEKNWQHCSYGTLWLWNIRDRLTFSAITRPVARCMDMTSSFWDKVWRGRLAFPPNNASGKVLNGVSFFSSPDTFCCGASIYELTRQRPPHLAPNTLLGMRHHMGMVKWFTHPVPVLGHGKLGLGWGVLSDPWGMTNTAEMAQCSPETGTLFRTDTSHTEPTGSPLTFCE